MSALAATTGAISAGSDLKRRLRRAEWRGRLRAISLVAPLLLFLLLFFLIPIGRMLWLSVDNSELPTSMPHFAAAIQDWDPETEALPDEAILALFAEELRAASAARELAGVARRLNTEVPGFRTTIMGTARRLPTDPEGTWAETLAEIDSAWVESETWVLLQRASAPVTSYYLLASLDLRRDASGKIVAAPPDQAIYRGIFARTFWISGCVTLFCLLLGYPLAYKLASLPTRTSNLLMILVLLPFWTSLLVRTTSWIVLLQQQGPINQLLQGAGLIQDPLQLIYNRFGVFVAMTHILLPFMILPLYSVMRGIDPALVRAASSLGARPFTAFRRIYLPLTAPGIGAGCLLVFILSIGYYITPALVGGASDQMVSWFIAFFTNQTVNWGMASALGSILLIAVLLIYWIYIQLVGVERMRLG